MRSKPYRKNAQREQFVREAQQRALTPLEDQALKMIDGGLDLVEATGAFRLAYLTCALANNRGNLCQAAKSVRVHRNSFSRAFNKAFEEAVQRSLARAFNGTESRPEPEALHG